MLVRVTFVFLSAALTGCTLNVIDKRISPEEIRAAFEQRDKAIFAIAEALDKIQTKKDKKNDKVK